MADAELHIHINNAVDMEKLSDLLNAAIAAKDEESKTVIPAGYRCVSCYNDDGGHTPTCQVGLAVKKSEASK